MFDKELELKAFELTADWSSDDNAEDDDKDILTAEAVVEEEEEEVIAVVMEINGVNCGRKFDFDVIETKDWFSKLLALNELPAFALGLTPAASAAANNWAVSKVNPKVGIEFFFGLPFGLVGASVHPPCITFTKLKVIIIKINLKKAKHNNKRFQLCLQLKVININ